MLEVMVSIVIISFGLLGLAGLQITGLRNNHSSHLRSVATQQAYDMAERVRANQAGVKAGNYDNVSTVTTSNTCITAVAPGCTAAQLAIQDVFEWNQRNTAILPSGQGIICHDSTPNDGTPAATACDGSGPFVIKIWWHDDRNKNELSRFATSFQP